MMMMNTKNHFRNRTISNETRISNNKKLHKKQQPDLTRKNYIVNESGREIKKTQNGDDASGKNEAEI